LRRHFEISLYFLIFVAVLTLISTGKLDVVSMLLPPAALLWKGYRWRHGRGQELSNRAATWCTGAYFIFFPIDLWLVSRILAADAQNPGLYAALLATIHLMLFAIIVRLLSSSTVRDYLFLTLMAFSCMLAAAILTVDTAFLVFFFIFITLAVSTFVALEMWRSAQGAVAQPIENGTATAHLLHNALGGTSTAIAIASLAIGAVIFLFLPRFASGYMSGFNLQPTLISGFTDNVELGQIGEIKKSSAVIMRVSVNGGLDAARNVHWRGVALTIFDGKRWYNEPHGSTTVTPGTEGWFHTDAGDLNRQKFGKPMQYTILLEPIASTALFFANQVESVRGRFNGEGISYRQGQHREYLLKDSTGSVFNPYHNFSRMQYEARSVLPAPPPAAVRLASTDYSPEIRETYLQLPQLDPRIPALARQITQHADTPYDKTRALEGYLRSHYGYTLELAGTPQADPLAYFLFQKRAGHCEYFAASMTVMLRSVGIPARYVNGFLTGEYNDIGGDFVVRASDAHSWVEVYFPAFGWLTFDPTPPTMEKSPGMFANLARYWDWLDLQWSEWVINYDFIHQFTLAQNLHRVSRDWTGRLTTALADFRRSATDRMEVWQSRLIHAPRLLEEGFAVLAFISTIVVLLRPEVRQRMAALWHLRMVSSKTLTPHLATLQYNEMLRILARRGIRKAPAQTPLEFATSVPDGNLAQAVREMTEMYHSVRFGGQTPDATKASSLLSLIQSRIQTFAHPR
jgi:protein-glutamine gamma-glutamyltransferase